MVKMSFPIFPNCKITFSCSAAETLWDGPTAATSWKFLTEATVTRPLKFKHQHCSCSCHLGALFLRTSGSPEPRTDTAGGSERLVELKSMIESFPFRTGMGEERVWSSSKECGNEVGVGAVPPSSIEDISMECMAQFILLGPLVRSTLSS